MASEHSTIRAVLVGCGSMSAGWLKAATALPQFEVVGLVDIRREAADQRKAEFKLDTAVTGTELERVLAETRPDVLFNCTIPEAHHASSLAGLRAGCHVLSEKPLAASMAEARDLVAAAENAGRLFAVTQNYRFNPVIRTVQAVLQRGAIGQPHTILADFMVGAHFGGFRDHMEHVLLLDMGIHTFDMARFLTGTQARSVFCHEWNPPGSWYDHHASAHALFEMSGGLVFNYRGSWCADGYTTGWNAAWRIIGTEGTLIWTSDGIRVGRIARAAVPGEFQTPLDERDLPVESFPDHADGHASVIRDFVRCVRQGGQPETRAADNILSLAMVFGAIASAERRERVAVEGNGERAF